MSELNIQSHLRKLKEEEKNKLEEIRQKKLADQEHLRRAIEKQNDEEELRNLKRNEEFLVNQLKTLKKKNFQLQIELSSWEHVARLKSEELKRIYEKLDRSHEQVWKSREEFCAQADSFIQKFECFSKQPMSDNTLIRKAVVFEDIIKINDEISNLKVLTIAEEEKETQLNKKLDDLEREKERLLLEPTGPEYIRLEEWIQITRDRCTELERRIIDKKKLIDEKKNVTDPLNTKLFSIVNLEDVKKLARFAQFNESK